MVAAAQAVAMRTHIEQQYEDASYTLQSAPAAPRGLTVLARMPLRRRAFIIVDLPVLGIPIIIKRSILSVRVRRPRLRSS
jgi:hypothetical protein